MAIGARVCNAVTRIWSRVLREGIGWLRDLLSLPAVCARTPSWGRAMTALGYLTSVQGNSDEAVRVLDESLSYWREVGEPRALSVALFFRGLAIGWPAGDEASLLFFEQSLELSRVRGPRWTTHFSLMALGEWARAHGNYTRAEALLNQSLSLLEVEGERHGGFFTLNSLDSWPWHAMNWRMLNNLECGRCLPLWSSTADTAWSWRWTPSPVWPQRPDILGERRDCSARRTRRAPSSAISHMRRRVLTVSAGWRSLAPLWAM